MLSLNDSRTPKYDFSVETYRHVTNLGTRTRVTAASAGRQEATQIAGGQADQAM